MAVTLAQIAKLANTHPSTVSLVLNGRRHDRVSEETRLRIEKIANELGYRVNRHAQGLVRQSTRTVALLVNRISNPFYGQFVSSIDARFDGTGYHMIPFETQASTVRERELLSLHKQGVCDLVISLSHYVAEEDESLASQPVVLRKPLWTPHDALKCPVPHTLVDYRPALQKLINRLEQSGRRRMGLLMHGRNAPYPIDETSSGYARTLRGMIDASTTLQSGAPFQAVANENDDTQVWFERTRKLLKAQPEIDVLLVHTAAFIAPVIEAARQAGRTIGQDLALATFDDPSFAQWIEGGITVLREPIDVVADSLARQALAILHGKSRPATVTVEAQLIERRSTRPELSAGESVVG